MALVPDSLAHPVRLRLARRLVDGGPATFPELVRAGGAHRNTVRRHLETLVREGILRRAPSVPAGRGRPVARYELSADGMPGDRGVEGLAAALASTLSKLRVPAGRLAGIGRAWGRRIARDRDVRAADLPRLLRPLGFDARLRGAAIELRKCPCPRVLPEKPALVCRLAIAIVEGMIHEAGGRVVASRHDPSARRCSAVLANRRAARTGHRNFPV